MKEAYWGYWLIVLGVFIIVVLLLVQNFTSTNSQDYYLVKSIAEASMEDAIDWAYYRQYGEAKINKEKFYESFLRRFAEEASIATTYEIEFTEVYEAPPKIGVKVSSKANSFSIVGDSESFDIVNKLDAILESSTKSTTGSSSIGDYYATGYNDLLLYVNDSGEGRNLTNCKIKFKDSICGSDTKSSLTIARCGKPTDKGINDKDYDPNETYCIAYKTDDERCTVTATYRQFSTNYCS